MSGPVDMWKWVTRILICEPEREFAASIALHVFRDTRTLGYVRNTRQAIKELSQNKYQAVIVSGERLTKEILELVSWLRRDPDYEAAVAIIILRELDEDSVMNVYRSGCDVALSKEDCLDILHRNF